MNVATEVAALQEVAGVVDRSERGAVLVTGPDAWSFLQSLVSADLDAVGPCEGAHSLLLTPQGKLDVDFRLLRVGDEAWLDCDPGFGPQLAASLNRFRIRVNCEVIERGGEWGSIAVRGRDAVASVGHLGVDLPDAPHAHVAWKDAVVVRVPWPDCDGVDVVGPGATVHAAAERVTAGGVTRCSPEAYEALRIELGIPRQGFDLDERTIPQEAFLEQDAVSFTKGCFLGQELVCRIDTRGHVNKYLRRLTEIDDGRPPPGAEIASGGKSVGTVTSSVTDPRLPAGALGYVRHEIAPPAEVELWWDGGAARATVEPTWYELGGRQVTS
jgi:folate-binding protein YgfZ